MIPRVSFEHIESTEPFEWFHSRDLIFTSFIYSNAFAFALALEHFAVSFLTRRDPRSLRPATHPYHPPLPRSPYAFARSKPRGLKSNLGGRIAVLENRRQMRRSDSLVLIL